MNDPAEAFIASVCRETFLSMWSYHGPRIPGSSKELCDVLVVCDPDVLIISVKNIRLPASGATALAVQRWHRKAVADSCKQIRGAERVLAGALEVFDRNGHPGLPLPPLSRRRVHRIAIAFGGGGVLYSAPLHNYGPQFHVLDERSWGTLVDELDTVSDFVTYLRDKEALLSPGSTLTFQGGEEDLLAHYLRSGREFPAGRHDFLVEAGQWDDYAALGGPRERKRKEDANSYVVDGIIENLAQHFNRSLITADNPMRYVESGLRILARESRLHRRILANVLRPMVLTGRPYARLFLPDWGLVYVLLVCPVSVSETQRRDELNLRTLAAGSRRRYDEITHVEDLLRNRVPWALGLTQHEQEAA